MDEIIYTAVRLVVMVTSVVVARYLIPWLEVNIDHQKFNEVVTWVNQAVMCAQQLMSDADGAEKKQTVMIFLQRLMEEKGIAITDEQLDTLIESAVKQMKISEGR